MLMLLRCAPGSELQLIDYKMIIIHWEPALCKHLKLILLPCQLWNSFHHMLALSEIEMIVPCEDFSTMYGFPCWKQAVNVSSPLREAAAGAAETHPEDREMGFFQGFWVQNKVPVRGAVPL